jgi:predicted permease
MVDVKSWRVITMIAASKPTHGNADWAALRRIGTNPPHISTATAAISRLSMFSPAAL